MENEIDNEIIELLKKDLRTDYTIPDIKTALKIKSREKVVASLSLLEGRGIVEVSKKKGPVKYYRIKSK
jgi:DNA-binding Lrp family transcriptional regulator